MEALLQWDTTTMHWINSGWSHPILDVLLTAARNKYIWLPLYVLVVSWILYNLSVRQSVYTLLFLAVSIFAADTISSKLIKYQVKRARPCQEWRMTPPVIVRTACGSGYSFTSSHATNHFCLAAYLVTVFGAYMRRWRHLWWLWAAVISIAQVYVGLHYPLDIMAGGLLGAIIGTSMGILCRHRIQGQR